MPTTNTKYIGADITAFTVGTNAWLTDLSDCSVTVDITTADGAGVTDIADFAVLTEYNWNATGKIFAGVGAASGVMRLVTVGGLYAVTLSLGPDNYTGTAMISSGSMNFSKGEVISYNVSLKGYGALTRA